MEHEASFLTHATFDEKWRQTAIGRYFRNIRTIILIILTLSAAGLATFFSLPRELNPSIEIPIVMVSTIYPGASPEDIENLVTIPLEDAVSGLSDTTSVTSSSQAGSSFITLEFASNVDPDKAKADVQSAVDSVSGLPEDAETPSVQKMDFEHQPALVFAVSGADPATLRNFTDVLEERLKDLPEIESVDLANNQPQEVVVSLLPELLSRYQLDPRTVSDSVSAALGSFPGGSLSSDHNTFSLAVDRQALSVEDLRNTPLRLNDTPLRLGQIATIEERGANNTSSALYATPDVAPQKAVTFSVFKTDSADTQAAVTAANDVFQKTNEEHGNHFTQSVTFDSGKEISKSFFQLFRDFSITVGLVFLVLILFFRPAPIHRSLSGHSPDVPYYVPHHGIGRYLH
ncbi:MAG: efflux RND transporter permease subunit [Candidatus Moraniibacteriota bacterium]